MEVRTAVSGQWGIFLAIVKKNSQFENDLKLTSKGTVILGWREYIRSLTQRKIADNIW